MTETTQTTRTSVHFGRTGGITATALALAVGMMGTTLPTPLYALYRQRFGFSELMITVVFATNRIPVQYWSISWVELSTSPSFRATPRAPS